MIVNLSSALLRNVRTVFSSVRCKYVDANKFRGSKGKFKTATGGDIHEITSELDDVNLDNNEYDVIANSAMNVTKRIQTEQFIFIIQPYIKWGPKKTLVNPEHQLNEAEALVRSLPKWSVQHSVKVSLENLDKRQIFGSGKLEELKLCIEELRSSGTMITCIFVSKGTLTLSQKQILEQHFKLPVMDRYSVVIQILRLHAISAEAKLQVAMAEIPYIWTQMKDSEVSLGAAKQRVHLTDAQKQMLKMRERKLRAELADIRSHRELLRNKRKKKDYPIVAVVGYTNAGKTSLIKALTNEKTLEPKDQLFATLDVTAHSGILPCKLEVIFMDTVGFMSDIPTGLIECFIATLEDAMMADIIIHVQDVSHENYDEQKKHVELTLKSLMKNMSPNNSDAVVLDNVINVGNKIDLYAGDVQSLNELKLVSSTTLSGVNDLLLEVEEKILKATNRMKIIIKVPMGGSEIAWLYKNSAVTETMADPENNQNMLVHAVISNAKLQQFRHIFVKK